MQQLRALMSRDVKVISPDMSIGEAAKKCAMGLRHDARGRRRSHGHLSDSWSNGARGQ